MKKSIVIMSLLLLIITANAQYPANLPSSGPISMQTIYNWMITAGEITAPPNSISNLNSQSHLSDKTAPYSLSDWYGYGATPFTTCGTPFSVAHVAGTFAPVNKLIRYGTVTSSLSGSSKCWITQNLGAYQQAASATDATDASAGWYWQFNRMRGYATGAIPAWVTISISENSTWIAANDPCTIMLGTGWRIPTYTELNNVDGSWSNYTNAYNSVLKIHAAGYLLNNSGVLNERGTCGYYWSSSQYNSTTGRNLSIKSSSSQMANNWKTFAFSVRCLKD